MKANAGTQTRWKIVDGNKVEFQKGVGIKVSEIEDALVALTAIEQKGFSAEAVNQGLVPKEVVDGIRAQFSKK
jgi:hypothetical protein